ncbi:hypothetical protein DFH07DRAFT_1023032 [Mycena maculata]|uniref:Uncharacterized protein n=1 Tax=Mycena maculata TaxID=230809 RepID=A0AAD7KDG6_9AGAR|nr:hypothetical protein DFH07DRAFT_1023032 [Mycena maculata]
MKFPSSSTSILSLVVALATLVTPSSSLITHKDTTPFDGQYIQANSSNEAVEWWWGHAIAEPIGSNPPAAFQFLFYQGYPFAFGPPVPTEPEFYIVINGFFPNGTQFAATIPATSGTVTAVGQEVTGTWGGAGGFKGSADLSTFTITLDASEYGFEGTLKLTSNAPHHFGCNTTTDAYFDSIVPADAVLSDAESVLFTQLGWAATIPGSVSEVDMTINGTRLSFTGQGYHDANWSPGPLNAVVSSWFFGTAQVGDYDLSYISVTPANSTKILNTGYLSRNGVTLQNQCSLDGTKTTDHSIITPYGLEHDAISGVDVPTGYIIQYVLANGEQFEFNLSSIAGAQNPDQTVYHRWVGRASGGKVGEAPGSGLTVFEWLNPGLVTYSPTRDGTFAAKYFLNCLARFESKLVPAVKASYPMSIKQEAMAREYQNTTPLELSSESDPTNLLSLSSALSASPYMSTSSASSSISSFAPSSRASSSTSSQPKDYALAFADLQSAYGLSGQAPSVSSKKSRSKTHTPKVAPAASKSSPPQKNYEAAFGALSSQFGVGGVRPMKV